MPPPLSARVELRADRPTLLLNDEPVAPLIYALSDCPGARWTWEEVPTRNITEFGRRGTRLFQADVWFEQMIGNDRQLDVTLARRQIAGITNAVPRAAVMLRLHVNAPSDWCEAHPAECVGYADTKPHDPPRHGLVRPLADDAQRPTRASFYSSMWQNWAHDRLREFCALLSASPEGDALFSIQIANGVYGEWHQFGFLHHDPDTSPAATVAFGQWLSTRYTDDTALAKAWRHPGLTFATATIPNSPSREVATVGILRDPQTQRPVIDYFTFQHAELTQIVLALAETVKLSWPRPIVTAAFFGYFYSIFGRQAAGAQLAVHDALKSPHLDCLCSPQSYEAAAKAFGGTGNARGLIGVVRRAGKLWLDEMDTPTSQVGCPWEKEFSSTPADDIAIHRRNVLQPVTRGGGQWWYDFGPVGPTPDFGRSGNCGWWDTPELLAEVKALQSMVTARHELPFLRPADVLLVHDPMSFCHTVSQRHPPAEFGKLPTTTSDPVTPLLVDDLLHGLYQSGLVFDEALLDELVDLDLRPYKLVLFATTPVITSAQREVIQARVASAGRHLALLGFAGWSDGDHVGPEVATALSGIHTVLHRPPVPEHSFSLGETDSTFRLKNTLDLPAYVADDDQIIGRWRDGSISVVRRDTGDATWWNFALPPVKPLDLHNLGFLAGCHAVNAPGDCTLIGDGLLVVHTIEGGKRQLQFPSGPLIDTELPARSTIVFDGLTGARLLG